MTMQHPTGTQVQTVRLPVGAVKIDGLRQPIHAEAAVLAGADLLGFIFAPARRRVSPADARRCLDAARSVAAGRPVLGVGVFVDATAAEMNDIAAAVGLDLLQLHGDETPDLLASLRWPVLKALRPLAGADAPAVATAIAGYRRVANAPVAFVIDGYSPSAAGGAGVRADWRLASEVARRGPTLLAGGLDPGNVAEAIGRVRPHGVDVSSGVETDGAKDEVKIAAFVRAAKRAFGSLSAAPPPAVSYVPSEEG